jgi:hypothetical protein
LRQVQEELKTMRTRRFTQLCGTFQHS